RPFLHHSHFHAELRRADRADIAARPRADDGKVELVCHGLEPQRSCQRCWASATRTASARNVMPVTRLNHRPKRKKPCRTDGVVKKTKTIANQAKSIRLMLTT